jgi:hypothetical protein
LATICLAAVLAFGLAACGGGSSKKTDAQLEMERLAALEMECTSAGGRFEDDESCTSAAELEMERVAALRMTCEGAGGRFEDDESCTSAAELVTEAAQMTCTDAGGRWESGGTCTSAAEVEMQRLAAEEAACDAANGRWNDDNTCTSAAELIVEAARMVCTEAGGRYESDGTCTPAAADVQQAHDALEAADMKVTMYTAANNSATDALDTANSDLADAVTALTALDGTATAADVADANAAYQQAVAAQAAAMAASETAKTNLATATQAYKDAYAALAAIDPNSTALMEARAKIAMLEDAAEKAAEKAKADLAVLQGQIDEATEKLAMLQKQIEDAAKALADAEAKAMAAGYTDALKRYVAQPDDHRAQHRMKSLEATSDALGAPLTVKRSGSTVTMSATLEKVKYVAQSEGPTSLMGWTGQTLVRTDKDIAASADETVPGTVTAVVYTDIEAPTPRPISSSLWTAAAFDDAFDGANFDTTAPSVASDGTLTIPLAGAAAGDDRTQTWPGTATGTGIPTTLNTTSEIDDRFSGTLNGLSGTFNCTAATDGDACTIKKISATTFEVSANLQFKANANQSVPVQDSEFMTFGYWVTAPDEGTGAAHHYMVGTFAAPVVPVHITDPMSGSASYEGSAAGVYAEKAHSGNTARSGSFTADAQLTADFDDATSDNAHISGTIDNFMENGESLGKWSIHLGGNKTVGANGALSTITEGIGATNTVTALTTASHIGDTPTETRTSGTFDGLSGAGYWQGQFSGRGTGAQADDAPMSVTGTFDATVGANVLNVAGAFGAQKK